MRPLRDLSLPDVTDDEDDESALPPVRLLALHLCPKADWGRMTDAAIFRVLRLPPPRGRERLEYTVGRARAERSEPLPEEAPLSMRAGYAAGLAARTKKRRRAGRRGGDRP